MRALALIAVLAASVAAAQPFYSTGTPTSGALAPSSVTTPFVDAGTVIFPQGGKLCLNGPSCTTYIWINGPNTLELVNGGAAEFTTNAGTGFITMPIWPLTILGRSAVTAAPVDGGSPTVYTEYGNCTLSANACTIAFKNAFSVGPRCTCSHVAAVPLACGPTAAASTSGFTLAVATGSGTVDWHCTGDR